MRWDGGQTGAEVEKQAQLEEAGTQDVQFRVYTAITVDLGKPFKRVVGK